MDDVATLQCPYCLETLEVWIDPDARGRMVQDCDVCCRPWELHVERDEDGAPRVSVSRA